MIAGLLCVLVFALLTVMMASGQTSPLACPSVVEYSDCNETDPPFLPIRVVTGRVVAKLDDPAKSIIMVNGACLFLFTAKEHKPVASVAADEKGRFTFAAVKPGSYRLVVRGSHNVFHAANRRIQVYPQGQGVVPKHIGLVVHLRPVEIADCSSISRE
jgi:hypothetical protein